MSPDAALLIALCRSPPAGTTNVAPKMDVADTTKMKTNLKTLTIWGETQHPTDEQYWEIGIFAPSNEYRDR